MDQTWVNQKTAEYREEFKVKLERVKNEIRNQPLLQNPKKYLRILNKQRWQFKDSLEFEMLGISGIKNKFYDDDAIRNQFETWVSNIRKDLEFISFYLQYYVDKSPFERYLDSEPMKFNGDILITDPCYVVKNPSDYPGCPDRRSYLTYSSETEYPDYDPDKHSSKMCNDELGRFYKDYYAFEEQVGRDWTKCDCGDNMEVLGIRNYMVRDTIYGDWGCTTYNRDTKEPMGHFCADAGLVGVFLLDEVLNYFPEYNDHIENTYTVTWIKDFQGQVYFHVEERKGTFTDDTEYHKKGETWVQYDVQVIGDGINKKTGQPIRFITSQTSL